MTPSTPRLLSDGRTWVLDVDPEHLPELAIPGLRARQLGTLAQVYGYIDAVAAACQVVGAEAPPHSEPRYAVPDMSVGLRPYQREGVGQLQSIMTANRGALLADEMGLGKTLQAIWLAKMGMKNGQVSPCRRVVVVTPGSARYTWVEELAKWGEPSVAVMLPKGAKGWKKQRELATSARWVITSYDLLPEVGSPYPNMLVVDECHGIKSQGAKRSQATLSMARMVPYRLLISATPAWNVPKDWWFLLELAFPGRFGKKHDFEARYADGAMRPKLSKAGAPVGNFWNATGVSHAEELRLRLGYYMVRREKREVAAELPLMTDVPIWLDAVPSATQALRAWGLKVPGCSFHDALLATLEAKIPTCVELAHSAKRFLLFTWMKSHAGIMSHKLNEEGTHNVLLHGEMSDAARRDAIALARSKGIGIVATIDSAGQSLNLQGVASYGIFHKQDDVPLKMIQARARLHRLGITEPVTWAHVLLKDSADEVVWRRSNSKLVALEASMPAMEGAREYRESLSASLVSDEQALAAVYAEMQGGEDGAG